MPSIDNIPDPIEALDAQLGEETTSNEIVTADQVAELYKEDDVLGNMESEYQLARQEYDESLPNMKELFTLYERARRHRSMLRFRCTTHLRRIRARKKLLLQRVMDKKLTAIRKQLGLNKPRRAKLDLL